MKRLYPATLTCALALMAGCTIPDASQEIAAFGTATGTLASAVSDRFNAEIASEAKTRKENAIAAGTLIYSLTPGCDKLGADISAEGVTNVSAAVTNCKVLNRLDDSRNPSSAELAQTLARTIADYGTALDGLSKSNLPGEIQASSATLLSAISDLASVANVKTSGLDKSAPLISASAGFLSRQAKARILKNAIKKADKPIGDAVASLITVLVEQGNDPLYPAIVKMQLAETAMQNATNNPAVYSRRVRSFETAQKAYQKAYAASPTVALVQIRKTHASLVDRLEAPATLAEFQNLITELQALKSLIPS